MFNHPTLLYHCYKDAERESRKNPDNNNGGGMGCMIVLSIVFIISLWQAALQVGGQGIIVAIVITLAIISGLCKSQ